MPPSLSVSVGVPPATVTASLRFSVSVTTLPTPRSPDPAVMPVPDATTEDTVGAVVSICGPRLGQARQREAGGVASTVLDGRGAEIDRRHRQTGGVLAGPDRVAEGQRVGTVAAGIGRRAAVVERQGRGAARNRHRLAHVQRQGDRISGVEIAGRRGLYDGAQCRVRTRAAGPPPLPTTTPANVAGRFEVLSAWPSRSVIVPLTAVSANAEVF